MQIFKKNQARIHSVITISRLRRETFGADLEWVMKSKKTFDEALQDGGLTIMAMSRIKRIWAAFEQGLDDAMICPQSKEDGQDLEQGAA